MLDKARREGVIMEDRTIGIGASYRSVRVSIFGDSAAVVVVKGAPRSKMVIR